MKKLRRMIVEIERVRLIDSHSQIYITKCAGCGGEEVELVAFGEAARIGGQSVEKIIDYAARGDLHLGLRPEALLVCLNSLLRCVGVSKSVTVH